VRNLRRGELLRISQDLSLVIVLLVTLIFIALLCLLKPDLNLSQISSAILGTSGTIVALALPAAELAGQSVTRTGEYWVSRFADPEKMGLPPSKKKALEEIGKVKEKALTARRGSLYVLCAFVLSSFALLTPRFEIGGKVILLDYVLIALAWGFLLTGAALFFPFTWSVYRLDALQDAEDAINHYPEPRQTPDDADSPPAR
jgi:hypothetical protein